MQRGGNAKLSPDEVGTRHLVKLSVLKVNPFSVFRPVKLAVEGQDVVLTNLAKRDIHKFGVVCRHESPM
jgi:hypothetical protein